MPRHDTFCVGDLVQLRVQNLNRSFVIRFLLKPRCTCPRVVCEAGEAHLASCLRGLYLKGNGTRLAVLSGYVASRMRVVPESFLVRADSSMAMET